MSQLQRENLWDLIVRVLPRERYEFGSDFELLMAGLIAAYASGMKPDDIEPLFMVEWGINKKLVTSGLRQIIVTSSKLWGDRN